MELAIGHVSEKNIISLERKDATAAWLHLASLGIPAAIFAGADGWLPNTETTSWLKESGAHSDFIPDIQYSILDSGTAIIQSDAMRCEFAVKEKELWKNIKELIAEYIDRLESGCWEVAL